MGRDKEELTLGKICRSLGDYKRGTYKNINKRIGFW